MKIRNKISTKIKAIGALLLILMLSTIAITIYLNQQNVKDALIINIAGKQRMLTQKISKNVFYINYNSNKDFYELNAAAAEFIRGLNILKHGDENKKIHSAPTQKIKNQIMEITTLWQYFYEDIQNFKILTNSHEINKDEKLKDIILSIYRNNTILLDNVDKLVTMYTDYSESKTESMKTFQYISATILLTLFIYSLLQLREIEAHAQEFMKYSKQLINDEDGVKLKPIEIDAESEIVEVSDTINCFINKINSAADYSNEALEQSKQASLKLEELTDEFNTIIDEIQDNSSISKCLNNSEDMVIESTEELLNSTKKLQILKEELLNLAKSCKEIK
ncbi:MAG: type IV pili methyl-accepting chemotaxis transducer N-terminal domain-containing protein [Campylobacterota bacterium]|nr:type IV pili methyl-accepting chemotaxis transducer N-terminal domain-containing protein [Campylobacterota bacterium]